MRGARSPGSWIVEVVALVEVVDEPGMGGLPSQQLVGQRARGGAVGRHEMGQPGEVLEETNQKDLPDVMRDSLEELKAVTALS